MRDLHRGLNGRLKLLSSLFLIAWWLGCGPPVPPSSPEESRTKRVDTLLIEHLEVERDPLTDARIFLLDGRPFSGLVVEGAEASDSPYHISVKNGRATYRVSWYPRGGIHQTLEMKEGVEHGKFIIYFPDGKKYVEQFYEHGRPVGLWRRWNRQGELVNEIDYSLGVPIPLMRQ